MKHVLPISLLLTITSFLARPAQAFDSKAHDIIEAQAYLRILRGTSPHLARVHPTNGQEIINYLIAHRALDVSPEVFQAQWQVLGNLPRVRSGDMDFVLNRQFSDNGQAFHFMATKNDLVRTKRQLKNSPCQPPPHLLISALKRCQNTLANVFANLVENCSRTEGRFVRNGQLVSDDFYAIIHSIVDSYSQAHVQRTPDNKRIEYLKPWTLTTLRFHSYAQWQHHIADTFDKEFSEDGLPLPADSTKLTQAKRKKSKKKRQKSSIVECASGKTLNPYQYPAKCLSPLAKEAQDAVEDFIVTTYEALQDSAVASAKWQLFQQRHFVADSTTIQTMQHLSDIGEANTKVWPEHRTGIQAAIIAAPDDKAIKAAVSLDLVQLRAFTLSAVGGFQLARKHDALDGLVRMQRTVEYGVGFRLPLTEAFSIRLNPILLHKTEGDRYTLVEAGAQVEIYPKFAKSKAVSFLRIELPHFSYEKGYFNHYVGLGVGWDFGLPLVRPLYSLGARKRAAAWRSQAKPTQATDLAITTARLGRTTTKIWWIFQGAYGARGTGGNFAPVGGELTWDRNESGERTGVGYGVMAKMMYQSVARRYNDEAFLVFQAGPTIRVVPFGLHFLLEPLTYTRAVTVTAPDHDIRGVYRREDVQSTAGVVIPVGNAEFMVELVRYSYGDHLFLQRPWLPAGFRLGYAF